MKRADKALITRQRAQSPYRPFTGRIAEFGFGVVGYRRGFCHCLKDLLNFPNRKPSKTVRGSILTGIFYNCLLGYADFIALFHPSSVAEYICTNSFAPHNNWVCIGYTNRFQEKTVGEWKILNIMNRY